MSFGFSDFLFVFAGKKNRLVHSIRYALCLVVFADLQSPGARKLLCPQPQRDSLLIVLFVGRVRFLQLLCMVLAFFWSKCAIEKHTATGLVIVMINVTQFFYEL